MTARHRKTIAKEISTLRRSLTEVDRSLRRFAAILSQLDGGKIGTRTQRRLTSKAQTSLRLQGRYMGYMRQLKPKQKAQVRRIKEAKGVRAAIQRAKAIVR